MDDIQFEKQLSELNDELKKYDIRGFYTLHNPNDKGSTCFFASFNEKTLPIILQRISLLLTVYSTDRNDHRFDTAIEDGLTAILESITEIIDSVGTKK